MKPNSTPDGTAALGLAQAGGHDAAANLVVLEGFHTVKHALRFAPDLVSEVLAANDRWRELTASLAPDVASEFERRVHRVEPVEFLRWSRSVHPTGVLGLAHRPSYGRDPRRRDGRIGSAGRPAPAVLLDDPRRPGNAGAVIRVAAAAEASGVLLTGPLDPWQPAVVRGAAGLQFALPVMRVAEVVGVSGAAGARDVSDPADEPEALEGPLIGFEADGRDIREAVVPPNAILAFGTEREGLSPVLRERCDQVVALPMQPRVSSLNLATSVAAVLYYLALNPETGWLPGAR